MTVLELNDILERGMMLALRLMEETPNLERGEFKSYLVPKINQYLKDNGINADILEHTMDAEEIVEQAEWYWLRDESPLTEEEITGSTSIYKDDFIDLEVRGRSVIKEKTQGEKEMLYRQIDKLRSEVSNLSGMLDDELLKDLEVIVAFDRVMKNHYERIQKEVLF